MTAEEVAGRVRAWSTGAKLGDESRCGVARTPQESGEGVVLVVAVGALADVKALPLRAHVGQWLRLHVRLHGGLRPEVFLQGPRGRPRHALATLRGAELESRFVLSEPGQWTVQVVATGETGPLPVAEALVFADVDPPQELAWPKAPGEQLVDPVAPASERLFAMLGGARMDENLKPLKLRADLSALAQKHAESMRSADRLGHNIGFGGPEERLRQAGLMPKAFGENVAFALSVARAHRTLWASPSHRFTLLHPDFDAVGVGVAEGDAGSVWVCELFAVLK